MIFIAGITIAILLQLLLLSKKEKSLSDRILFFWMLVISFHLFSYYVVYSKAYLEFPHTLGMGLTIPFLYGVFIYFYTGALTSQLPKRKILLLFHFIPFLLFTLELTSFFMLTGEEKIFVYENEGAGFEQSILVRQVSFIAINIGYIIWSLILLHRHQTNIHNQFSEVEDISLNWLKLLNIGNGCVLLLAIFLPNVYIFAGIVLFVFIVGFMGIRQQTIFTSNQQELLINDPATELKYAKSGLTKESSEKVYAQLLQLIEKEEIYKDSEISLVELAAKLDVNPNYLSQVINEKEGKNFYDFINNLRLQEFKRIVKIPENQNLTILSLAYDSGFNSKTSFNRYFKKAMDQTPSQYLSQVLKV